MQGHVNDGLNTIKNLNPYCTKKINCVVTHCALSKNTFQVTFRRLLYCNNNLRCLIAFVERKVVLSLNAAWVVCTAIHHSYLVTLLCLSRP